MEELFNKPVLDQMYDFRKEDFEQTIYDNNAEIKEIESKVYEVSEKFNNFLKKVISDPKDYDAALEMFRNYELTYSDEIEFWNRTYFKLGMTDREKDGTSDHVGIVTRTDVVNRTIYTIEGNTSNKCAERMYSFDDVQVMGYGSPKY